MNHLNFNDTKQYIDANYPLTLLSNPLDDKDVSAGKRPILPNWQNKPLYGTDITDSQLNKNNLGFVLQADDLVLDYDPRNDIKEGEAIKRFNTAINANLFDIATVIIKTGSGGYHFYFKKQPEIAIKKHLPQIVGNKSLEFKTKGTQVVCAGGLHKSGNFYRFYKNNGLKPHLAPDAIIELIKSTKQNVFENSDFQNKSASSPIFSEGQNGNNPVIRQRCTALLKNSDGAIEGDSGDTYTFQIICKLKDFGLPKEEVLEIIEPWNDKCSPPWKIEELQKKINNAYMYGNNPVGIYSAQSEFSNLNSSVNIPTKQEIEESCDSIIDMRNNGLLEITALGKLKPTFRNTKIFCEKTLSKDAICYNSFSHRIVSKKSAPWHDDEQKDMMDYSGEIQWDDQDTLNLKNFFIEQPLPLDVPINLLEETIAFKATENKFNPVKEYFKELEWDGHSRIHTYLADYAKVEQNPYTSEVGLLILLSAIARTFVPYGVKFDYLPVLEGGQGNKKSTFWKHLCPFKFWFTDNPVKFGDKDFILQMQGILINEMAELTYVSKTHNELIKAILSQEVDRVRPPYARYSKNFPRRGILVGTSNRINLVDETGARRFLPMSVSGELDAYDFLDVKDQIWAEAYQFYLKNKERPLTLLHPEAKEIAKKEQEARFVVDDWEGVVKNYIEYDGNDLREKPLDKISSKSLWHECFGKSIANVSRMDQNRMSNILHRLGFCGSTIRIDGKTLWGYKKK